LRRARGLTLLSIAAVLFSVCAPVTYGIGAALGSSLVIIALVLRVRGFRWKRPLSVGLVSVGLTVLTMAAWARFIVGTAEVESPAETARHADAEASFDAAFDKAEAPPPARTRRGGDAGTEFGDDAGIGASRDGGPGRSE
jgi:hypothetical protein